jgi:cytoskeletal protein RodZ
MDSLATELKNAREQKGMSLSDIADATLINIRFLREIEQGNFSFLPQTYVRAFLREYAAMVGLDPDSVLRSFESTGSAPPSQATATSPLPAPPPAVIPAPSVEESGNGKRINPTRAWIAIVVFTVLTAIVVIWNTMDSNTATAVREIPFDQIRAEQERKAAADTGGAPLASQRPAVRDTLVLTAVATDSVWVQVGIDNAAPRNLFLKPGSRNTWRAAGRFLLTLGNAGAVEFTLNKKALGKLGKPGSVAKNVELNHATLTRK